MRSGKRFAHEVSSAGFAVAPVFVLLLVVVLVGSLFGRYTERKSESLCRKHLYHMYTVMEMYEIEHGHLPSLSFYPDDPRHDEESLRVFLEKMGLNGDVCVCPSAPKTIRETGLTYLWNIKLNQQKLSLKNPVWMLVELNALSSQVSPPHRGNYLILYSDGRIERSALPPSDSEPNLFDGGSRGADQGLPQLGFGVRGQ